MLIFGKEVAYWKEKLGGIIIGFILSVFVFLISPELSKWKEFIKEIPNIGMCTFGFLLTFLGIILQGGSNTIEWMKSRETLFQRFIDFNRRIVILSIVISVYAYFLAFFNFEWIRKYFTDFICIYQIISKISISLFVLLSVWFLYDVMYFIKVFYLLIKKN
jgi:hypothetical protein